MFTDRLRTGANPSSEPCPEDVFLSWLLSKGSETDLLAATESTLERLEEYRGPHPEPGQLAAIFSSFRDHLLAERGLLSVQYTGTG